MTDEAPCPIHLILNTPEAQQAMYSAIVHMFSQWRDVPPYRLSSLSKDDALARATTALAAIREITAATHAGQERAYTALSRIDGLAREGAR